MNEANTDGFTASHLLGCFFLFLSILTTSYLVYFIRTKNKKNYKEYIIFRSYEGYFQLSDKGIKFSLIYFSLFFLVLSFLSGVFDKIF